MKNLIIKILKSLKIFMFISAICLFVLIGIFSAPYIVGKYQLYKFFESIHPQMNREQVHTIADEIGYLRVDLDPNVNGNMSDYSSNQIVDVYFFRNIMLESVVAVHYDENGNVIKIIED